MTDLQALAMDRHLGHNFKISAGSILVVLSISISKLTRLAFNTLGMGISAPGGVKEAKTAHDNHLQDQQGVAAAVSLYHQEFTISMKYTETSVISIYLAIAFYVSTALVDLIRNVSGWLPDDINHGRLDNVYWTIGVIGLLNFGYFLLCSKFYKYQNRGHEVETNSHI